MTSKPDKKPADKSVIEPIVSPLITTPLMYKLGAGDEFKNKVFGAIGDLSRIQLLGTRVVVATYIEPEKTAGGIYITQKRQEESRFQGKAGLVIAIGPTAFKYNGVYEYEGPKPSVGDWVMFFPSDGREFEYRGIKCRSIESELISMVLDSPESVW